MKAQKQTQYVFWIELFLIVLFSIPPLFFNHSYRINIFLSWDGAYRLSEGQLPFRDFYLPMGFGYWLVPAAFFSVLGASFSTLIKAQVFINIISGITFRGILNTFEVPDFKRVICVLVYSLTFIIGNFWPWYNHSVIVYELIGFYFLLNYILYTKSKHRIIHLAVACFFIFFAFFTKQDAGAMGVLIALILMLYTSLIERKVIPVILFILFFIGSAVLVIGPFLKYDFAYWFNLGQPPHNSRISTHDFITIIMGESRWEKFYFAIICVLTFIQFKKNTKFFYDKKNFVFLLFTLGILVEAALFQVTSYVPRDNNIFFHAFCISYILFVVDIDSLGKPSLVYPLLLILIMIIWSEAYWKYLDRIVISKLFKRSIEVTAGDVGMNSYLMPTPCDTLRYSDPSTWEHSKYNSFQDILMPQQTVDGLDYIMNLPVVKEKGSSIKILNMTELTPLAKEIGYTPQKQQPLWYHLGVGMFEKETNQFCERIRNQEYDLVLFEYIPGLNNFYPFEIKDCLSKTYSLKRTFKAPRSDFQGFIEVYMLN